MKKKENNQFIDIAFTAENLDVFLIRTSIFNVIKKNMSCFNGKLLDIGCGKMPYREYLLKNSPIESYIGLDIETALVYDEVFPPDFKWNGKEMPFSDNSFDCGLATEVLEHCPEPELVLMEIERVLKPGGFFLFTVPFLWNLHEVPNDHYRYTPFSLRRHLRNVGFSDIEIKPMGGWHASLAQMLGLWVKRSPLSARNRRIFTFVLKPLIKQLLINDQKKEVTFKEGQMVPSLYGIAKKTNNEI